MANVRFPVIVRRPSLSAVDQRSVLRCQFTKASDSARTSRSGSPSGSEQQTSALPLSIRSQCYRLPGGSSGNVDATTVRSLGKASRFTCTWHQTLMTVATM